MKYNDSNKPIQCIMKNSTCYKGTGKATPIGVLWHSTGANNPNICRYVQPYETDENYNELIALLGKNKYKNDWNHVYRKAGVNAWVGKLADGSVATVQTLPWDYAPWGCGAGKYGSCNGKIGGRHWVQFEICEGNLTDKVYFDKVYKEACELTAYLCKMYNIDPKGTETVNGVVVPTILCHKDSYNLGLGSNHGDVLHWFKKHGKTMNDVRNDVAILIGKTDNVETTITEKLIESNIKKGSVVSIVKGAKYYNGKTVPSWVIKKNWIVKENPKEDRVVIDKSLDGKNSICSAISSKYLTIVSGGSTSTTTKPTATTAITIKKYSKVKVKSGAKTYTGGNLASFVYKTTYTVLEEPKGDRVVIGLNGQVTAAIHKKNLILVK